VEINRLITVLLAVHASMPSRSSDQHLFHTFKPEVRFGHVETVNGSDNVRYPLQFRKYMLTRRFTARGTRPKLKEGQSEFGSAPVNQTSTWSAMARASSTSIPRYRTVLSTFLWPNEWASYYASRFSFKIKGSLRTVLC
jgi:hypothetical protein